LEVRITKKLANLVIKITKTPTAEDKAAPGFHDLLPKEEI